MLEKNWTEEPWEGITVDHEMISVVVRTGEPKGSHKARYKTIWALNGEVERMLACVNACAGIPIPERLPGFLNTIEEFIKDHDPKIMGIDPSINAIFHECLKKYLEALRKDVP